LIQPQGAFDLLHPFFKKKHEQNGSKKKQYASTSTIVFILMEQLSLVYAAYWSHIHGTDPVRTPDCI
jgi:hypothetical protein